MTRARTYVRATSLCAIALLGFGACSGSSPSPSTKGPVRVITIPGLLPTTGEHANTNWTDAVQMATEDMNLALQGENVSFVLDLRNDDNVIATASALATEFFKTTAPVILSDTSGSSLEVNKLNYDPAQTIRIPVLCGSCTQSAINNPDFTKATALPFEVDATRDLDNWLRRTTITDAGRLNATLREILSRGANHDGDLNGDGVTKLVILDPNITPVYLPLVKAAAPGFHPNPSMLRYENLLLTQEGVDQHDYNKDLVIASNTLNETTGETDGTPDFYLSFAAPVYMPGMVKAYKNGGYDSIPMLQGSSFLRTYTLQALGATANGQESTANQLWTGDVSGTLFAAAFEKRTGSQPAGYDTSFYDAAVFALLGVLKAALPLDDPAMVTPALVQVALDQLNVPGAQIIHSGAAEFKKAITAIRNGTDINYEGASGPCDFDSKGNVVGRISQIKVENQRWVETQMFDCVANPSCPTTK